MRCLVFPSLRILYAKKRMAELLHIFVVLYTKLCLLKLGIFLKGLEKMDGMRSDRREATNNSNIPVREDLLPYHTIRCPMKSLREH